MEIKTSYHFYFDSAQFGSFTVNVIADNESLKRLMNKVFFNTNYFAAIHESNVFLTSGEEIITDFNERPGVLNAGKKTNGKQDSIKFSSASNMLKQNKIYEVGLPTNILTPGKARVSGYVTDAKSGDGIAGAVIIVDNTGQTIETNKNGYYSMLITKGGHELMIRERGKKEIKRNIFVYSNGELPVELMGDIITLKEVLISSKKNLYVNSTQMGLEKLTAKSIKQVPVVFGEADILRVVLTLPGVKSAGEASTGFNVRGGAADQNLILFNDATVYNPAHFFGFFSAFNPELVKM